MSILAYGQMDTTMLSDVDLWAVQVQGSEGALNLQLDSSMQVGYFRLSESISAELPIYVKSYGPSAVATFSVRGTGAQHTEVLWNGMSVNSPMLGLFDLNLVSPSAFDQIDFIYGGASLPSGVSSFGGALNLSNEPRSSEHFQLGLLQVLGSYKTNHTEFDLSASNGAIFWRTKLLWDYSLNDFEYTNPRLTDSPTFVNEHAEVNQNQWIQEAGVRLNSNNTVMARLWLQQSNRQIPGLMSIYPNTSAMDQSTQNDVQQRVQAEWTSSGESMESQVRAGFSSWAINFDEDESVAQTWQGQWRTQFSLDSLTEVETLLQYIQEQGDVEAYPNGESQRSRYAAALSVNRRWEYLRGEFQAKQERIQGDWAPFQYQLGIKATYGAKKQWGTRFRTATQVRYPTLNDLFWGVGGQLNLSPEKSFQNEISQELEFNIGAATMESRITGFTNHVENYILWLPQSDLTWRATNIDLVEILGAEVDLSGTMPIFAGKLNVGTSYSYTQSRDQQGHQLIFIPLHQARLHSSYSLRKFTFSLNFVFQGSVYTDRENEFYMPWYQTADLRCSYKWYWGKHQVAAFVQSANVTDVHYQTIPLRPMPGRTFQIGAQWRLNVQ